MVKAREGVVRSDGHRIVCFVHLFSSTCIVSISVLW